MEEGQGLAIQALAIRRWVKEHGHHLVGIHRDKGVSGTLEEREGLQEALAAIRFNGVQGLVVHSIDRLARSLTVQEAVLAQVWSAGGRIFTVDQGEVPRDDPEDPARTFVRQVMGAVAQLERGMIVRRLRRGRLHKAAQRGYAYGAPPYGWRAKEGRLMEDPGEQAVIGLIRQHRSAGASFRQIAEHLNREGVHPKRAKRWHPETVKRVLNRQNPQG